MTSNDDDQQEKLRKEYEAKLEALRQALIEGEQSGIAEPFDFDAFIKEMHERSRRKKQIDS
jgi:antitoxin ParD1/3/4